MIPWLFIDGQDAAATLPAADEHWFDAAALPDGWTLSRPAPALGRGADGRWAAYPADTPRPYHDPSTLEYRGILVEPLARTQLVLRSRGPDGTVGVNADGSTITTDATVQTPFGMGATKVVPTVASAQHGFSCYGNSTRMAAIPDGAVLTVRITAKFTGTLYDDFRLFLQDRVGTYRTVRVKGSAGTVTPSAAEVTATLEYDTDGFFTVTATMPFGTGATAGAAHLTLYPASDVRVHVGDGTSGLYVAYYGIEVGQEASSPMLSDGAGATRPAETLSSNAQWLLPGPKTVGVTYTPLTARPTTVFLAAGPEVLSVAQEGTEATFATAAGTPLETSVSLTAAVPAAGIERTLVAATDDGGARLSVDGLTVAAESVRPAPHSLSEARIGSDAALSAVGPLLLRRLKYWAYALNAEQASAFSADLSTPGSVVAGLPSLSVPATLAVTPAEPRVVVQVTLAGEPSGPAVSWRTEDGTATAADYVPTSGRVVLDVGQTSVNIPVELGTRSEEEDRTFHLDLFGPERAVLGNRRCTVTLQRLAVQVPAPTNQTAFGAVLPAEWTLTRATSAVARNASGIWVGVPSNAHRHHHAAPGVSGILVQGASSEQRLYDSVDPGWTLLASTKSIDTATQAMVGNRTMAWRKDATDTTHRMSLTLTTSNSDAPTGEFTLAATVRPVGVTHWRVNVRGIDNVWHEAVFTLSGSGAVASSSPGCVATVERDPFFPDWYTVALNKPQGTTAGTAVLIEVDPLSDAAGTPSTAGNTGHGIDVVHLQIEPRAGYGAPIPVQAAFFASPSGNDAWTGRLSAPNAGATDGPVATVGRALDLATAHARIKCVVVRAGTYALADKLTFWTNRAGMRLVAYPGEVPVLDGGTLAQHVQVVDTTGVSISGIKFTNGSASGMAIEVNNSSWCWLDGLTIDGTGVGIKLYKASDNRISGCTIANTKSHGVEGYDTCNRNKVYNNYIHHVGTAVAAGAGVAFATGCSDNVVAFNDIEYCARYGVSFKDFDNVQPGTGNKALYNRIKYTNTAGGDTGGIETLGRSNVAHGHQIVGNFIEDTGGLILESGIGASGVYLDDLTNDTIVRGNFIKDISWTGVMIHGGDNNTVENNFMVLDAADRVATISNNGNIPTGSVATGNVFRKNVAWSSANIASPYQLNNTGVNVVDQNLLFNVAKVSGVDDNSVFADPLFTNAAAGDYSLAAGSPAFALGITDLEWSRMGRAGLTAASRAEFGLPSAADTAPTLVAGAKVTRNSDVLKAAGTWIGAATYSLGIRFRRLRGFEPNPHTIFQIRDSSVGTGPDVQWLDVPSGALRLRPRTGGTDLPTIAGAAAPLGAAVTAVTVVDAAGRIAFFDSGTKRGEVAFTLAPGVPTVLRVGANEPSGNFGGSLLVEAFHRWNVALNDEDAAALSQDLSYSPASGGGQPVVSVPLAMEAPEGQVLAVPVSKSGAGACGVTAQTVAGFGTAVAGADYTALAPTAVSFAAGETAKTVSVPILADVTSDAGETFRVAISAPTGCVLGNAACTVTVTEPPWLSIPESVGVAEGQPATVTVAKVGTGACSIRYRTVAGTAAADTDYTATSAEGVLVSFAAGETAKEITVQTAGDAADEPDEEFDIVLMAETAVGCVVSNATCRVTVIDDDAPLPTIGLPNAVSVVEGQAASVTVTKSGAGACSISFQTQAVTATSGTDYTAVPAPGTAISFAANETAKTIAVQTTQDAAFEGPETFDVVLLAGTASGCTVSNGTCRVTITDDEAAPLPALSLPATATVPEGDLLSVTITKSGTGACSVNWITQGITATFNVDYAGAPAAGVPVSFAAGETTKTITVQTTEDSLVEAEEYFNVLLMADTAAGCTIANGTCRVAVVDDDAPPTTGLFAPARGFSSASGFGIAQAGGDYYRVTTNATSGTGSLQAGLALSNRLIIFEVGGTFSWPTGLPSLGSNLTVAGETAPYPGVVIQGSRTNTEALATVRAQDNIHFSHITFERGYADPQRKPAGRLCVAADNCNHNADTLSGQPSSGATSRNIHWDHCAFFWGVDETVQVFHGSRGPYETTGCWEWDFTDCIIAQPLFEPGWVSGVDYKWENGTYEQYHNYGMIVGPYTERMSIQHCLWGDHSMRGPFISEGSSMVVANNAYMNCDFGASVEMNQSLTTYPSGVPALQVTCVGQLMISGTNKLVPQSGFRFVTYGSGNGAQYTAMPAGSSFYVHDLYAMAGSVAGAGLAPTTVTWDTNTKWSHPQVAQTNLLLARGAARPLDIPGAPVAALTAQQIYDRAVANAGPRPKEDNGQRANPAVRDAVNKLRARTGRWINVEWPNPVRSTATDPKNRATGTPYGGVGKMPATLTRRELNGSTAFPDGVTIAAPPAYSNASAVRAWLEEFRKRLEYD